MPKKSPPKLRRALQSKKAENHWLRPTWTWVQGNKERFVWSTVKTALQRNIYSLSSGASMGWSDCRNCECYFSSSWAQSIFDQHQKQKRQPELYLHILPHKSNLLFALCIQWHSLVGPYLSSATHYENEEGSKNIPALGVPQPLKDKKAKRLQSSSLCLYSQ